MLASKLSVSKASLENSSSSSNFDFATGALTTMNGDYGLFLIISLIFYFIFLFVWLLEKNKNIAIYRLNGLSLFWIANRLFARAFTLVTLLCVGIASLWILQAFNLSYLLLMLGLFALTQLISYLAIALVSRQALVSQLKNKSFIKRSHYLLMAVKLYIFAISIGTTASAITLFNNGLGMLGETHSIRADYGILFPPSLGYVNSSQNSQLPQHTALFDYAEQNGALYALPFVPPVPGDSSLAKLSLLRVNDNYLKKFPVLDSKGHRIQIDAADSSGIVLLSAPIKSDEDQLKQAYQANPGLTFQTSQIKFYTIKAQQNLPVLAGSSQNIRPDIIEVYTAKNASSQFITDLTRANDAEYDGIVFPIKGSLAKTYQGLKVALNQDNNLAQYPSFIRANEVPKWLTLATVGNPLSFFLTDGFAIFLFVGMIFATISFYFKLSRRKIAIQRFQGLSYSRSYWPLGLILVIQYLGVLIYDSLTQDNFLMINGGANIHEMLLIFFILEVLITAGMIYRLEKHNILNTLKGD